ncbi:hypothetical protein EVAR_21891_1 [Eumeta japonica]|uniref:Uncharacterized protein n=1 Tax=Eumeta variegata TaxID=151549 RepID=A0A4C2A6G0_EUMVA|nr:hypothetical protein EVAR_21891_1 [Eumeta japonica]
MNYQLTDTSTRQIRVDFASLQHCPEAALVSAQCWRGAPSSLGLRVERGRRHRVLLCASEGLGLLQPAPQPKRDWGQLPPCFLIVTPMAIAFLYLIHATFVLCDASFANGERLIGGSHRHGWHEAVRLV